MAQVSHREDLIWGAIRCLQTKGYARTTARDITAESGANLGSIVYHFGSKEALLNEALMRVFVERDRYVSAVAFAADDAPPLDRLTTTFTAVRDIFEQFRPLLVAFVEAIAQAERSPELREQMATQYRDARARAGELLRAGLGDAGRRLRRDPTVMASFLLATLDGLVLQYLLDPADTPAGDELVDALAEWMRIALERSPGPREGARGIGRARRRPDGRQPAG